MSGILRLESLTKGNTLKQGDKTPLKYRLFDADGEKLNIASKLAKVRLVYPDFLTIGYEKDGLTVAQDDTITFTIDKIIPAKLYHVEIIVDDKFIFPSRADESKFTVDKSSLATETNIIEIVGVDAVARKATGMMKQDKKFIDDMTENVISDSKVQSFAQGIDAKATNALSLSESADTLSKSVQEQFNQVVIDGDSSVEAAQARVDASGQTNPTLKARLDKEHNEVTAQLAEKIGELGAVATFKGSDTNANILGKTGMQIGDEWFDTTNQMSLRWNGSAWVEVGGTLKLGDNTIGHAKLTAKSVGDRNTEYPLVRTTTPSNLFDKTKSTENFFVSWVTGQLLASESYSASDYMDVTPGAQVAVRYFNQTAFYDLSLNFKSGVSGETQTNQLRILTVPAGAYKMRISTLKKNLDRQQINRGTSLSSYDDGIPKIEDKSIADNSLRATALKNNSVTSKQTEYPLLKSVKSSNLYDKDSAIKGKYVSATSGLVFDNATYELLQNIEIEPSTQYTIAHLNQIAFKDEDGTFISGQPATPNPNGLYTFSTPLGAKFMDVSTLILWSDKQQINKGSALLAYENGQPKIDSSSIIGGAVQSRLNGLTWNVLGDSFTQAVEGGSPKYHLHIANATGVKVNDYGISGSTVSTVGGGGYHPMVNRYQDMADADIITLFGGINDGSRESFALGDMSSTDISTFYGAYKTTLDGLIAKYPLKTVLTITPTFQNDMERHAPDIVKAIKEISESRGIPCLDLYANGGFNAINMAQITKDGLHPTDFGHKWLAGKILAFLESNIPLL